QSSLIGKIEKAKRYAQEPDRIRITELRLSFKGENSTHSLDFRDEKWNCDCRFFSSWNTCSHTMALERLLGVMIPQTSPIDAVSP
ncbi:MAG: hypothetical protein ACE5KI_05015, partial [Dehalococcoidia bacterium]